MFKRKVIMIYKHQKGKKTGEYINHKPTLKKVDWDFKFIQLSMHILQLPGFPGGSDSKESANLPAMRRPGFNPWVGKIPWRRKWLPTPVSSLAWKLRWTEEPGGLQTIGAQRVAHDWAANTSLLTSTSWNQTNWFNTFKSEI